MKLSNEQIKNLVQLIGITREEELNCNQCLDQVAEFAEHELSEKPIPDALKAVIHHLSLCMECREEYEDLLKALEAMREDET